MINIKKSWDEVTINEFIQITEATEKQLKIIESLSSLEVGEYMIDYNVKILSILSGLKEEEIYNMPAIEIDKLGDNIMFLTTQPEISNPKETIIIGDEKFHPYGIIERLKKMDLRAFKAIQYIDSMNVYLSVPEADKVKKIHILMAILLRREGHQNYNEYGFSLDENAEIIKNGMSIVDAFTVQFFFSEVYEALTQAIQTYSNKVKMKN